MFGHRAGDDTAAVLVPVQPGLLAAEGAPDGSVHRDLIGVGGDDPAHHREPKARARLDPSGAVGAGGGEHHP